MNKSFFAEKPLSFYTRIILVVLALIPIVYIISKMSVVVEYPWTLIMIICGVAVEVSVFFFSDKPFAAYLSLGGSLLLSAAFSLFMLGGVLSISDYVAHVNFWGDATQFPYIITYGIILLVSTALAILNCFLKITKQED